MFSDFVISFLFILLFTLMFVKSNLDQMQKDKEAGIAKKDNVIRFQSSKQDVIEPVQELFEELEHSDAYRKLQLIYQMIEKIKEEKLKEETQLRQATTDLTELKKALFRLKITYERKLHLLEKIIDKIEEEVADQFIRRYLFNQ